MHRWFRTPPARLPVALPLALAFTHALASTACCPHPAPGHSQTLTSIKSSLSGIEQAQRAHHNNARRSLPQVAELEQSCSRVAQRLESCRTCCPCKDLVTPLALQRILLRARLAALRVHYAERHPRIKVLEKTLEVNARYLAKLKAQGPQVDHCKLAAAALFHAYRVERTHVEYAGRYGPRHPKLRAVEARLAVFKKAEADARAKCKPTR